MLREDLLKLIVEDEEFDVSSYSIEFLASTYGFEYIGSYPQGETRWGILYLSVLRDADGLFGIFYETPATEYQEGMESNARLVEVKEVITWGLK
jgi:hypothetical protein